MQKAQPILVTGSHRSGSTWVGKTLSMSPSIGYIREPFSVLHRRGVCDVDFPYWFPYICRENEAPYVRPIRDTLAFRYGARAALRSARTPRDVALMGYDWREFRRYASRRARPLMKDPIAVFSAEWLCDTFDMQVVALVRHPAAFVSSLKKYSWTHPFDHFLKQPLLMRDLLQPFADEVAEFARVEHEVVDQAILLWNLIHHAILRYRDRRPDWLFLRHEDISLDPVARFRDMYEYLGVDFTPAVERDITAATGPSNPAEIEDAGVLRRDSRSAIHTWRTRLSAEEIERVRAGTQAISRALYPGAEWYGGN